MSARIWTPNQQAAPSPTIGSGAHGEVVAIGIQYPNIGSMQIVLTTAEARDFMVKLNHQVELAEVAKMQRTANEAINGDISKELN
jgi:hypothetical protein